MSLTPENLEKARAMRADNASWGTIVAATGISMYVLRAQIDPNFKEHRREQVKRYRLGRTNRWPAIPRREQPKVSNATGHAAESAKLVVPEYVLADRERRREMAPQSLTAALLGDPLPGQREYLDALSRRRGV